MSLYYISVKRAGFPEAADIRGTLHLGPEKALSGEVEAAAGSRNHMNGDPSH